MAKTKKVFTCTACGNNSPKWMGKCNSCGAWNTYQEEILVKEVKGGSNSWHSIAGLDKGPQPTLLPDIATQNTHRMSTGDQEFDRVLGNGLVAGSITLVAGNPGIGKSTLLLQTALHFHTKVLYVSGEESEEQIKMRSNRLKAQNEQCYILTETNIEKVLMHAKKLKPGLVIIDSIQTIYSPHLDSIQGSISQLKECAGSLQRFAKETGIPVVTIGHITKDGAIAGPKLLEHIVDTVLQFEGDRNYNHRLLRSLKNRFGATDEIGIYQMEADGLKEVQNPSELLIAQKDDDLSGSTIAATIEGLRSMLIETQALVSNAVYGNPQRSATGFDMRRLSMLLAVLEKKVGFPFGQNDVFLNIAGGLKVVDPAIDLAIVAALISSLEDFSVPTNICFAGEIGLSGEIRTVTHIEQRIQEADRLGFEHIFLSKYHKKNLSTQKYKLEIHPIGKIEELYNALFQ